MTIEQFLSGQYQNADKLNTRIDFHIRFSTNKYPWMRWVFDQFDFPTNARILEIGTGPAALWQENADRIGKAWQVTLSDYSKGMLETAIANTAQIDYEFSFENFPVENIPHAENKIDAVIANHMLYYAEPLETGLREIRRVLKPDGAFYATTNGSQHLNEIDDIVVGVGGDERLIQHITDRFNLEKGPEDVGKFFDQVTVMRQPNSLIVDEAAAITAYILSGTRADTVPMDSLALTAHISNIMRKNGGTLNITKDAGLIIAN